MVAKWSRQIVYYLADMASGETPLTNLCAPQAPYLSDTQAWIEYRKGNYPGALEALQPSFPHAEQVPEIAYHAGAIHAKLGDRSKAVHFLRLSLQFGQKEAKTLLEHRGGNKQPVRRSRGYLCRSTSRA